VPAHAIANMMTKGIGNSSRSPDALKMARAVSAKAMPTKAHTIQDGKYEPKMLREGAPSQPLNKHRIGAARLRRTVGEQRMIAPRLKRSAKSVAKWAARDADPPTGERIPIFIGG
jgi:hypothetical protein